MLITTPVYCQLNDALRDLIRQGEFREGDRFLTERQIGERFGVSRATANKALSNLVAEGIVEFRKGIGTFVRGGVLDYDLRALVSFSEKARAAGKTPSTEVFTFETASADHVPSDIRQALRLRSTDEAYYIERLRCADAVPVILEKRYLATRFCPGLDTDAVSGSLYETITARCRLEVSGADETIRAVSIVGSDARVMNVEPGAAGLLVVALGYLSGGVPLWHERTLYRGDAYEFRNRLGPIQTARPAAGVLIAPPEGEIL